MDAVGSEFIDEPSESGRVGAALQECGICEQCTFEPLLHRATVHLVPVLGEQSGDWITQHHHDTWFPEDFSHSRRSVIVVQVRRRVFTDQLVSGEVGEVRRVVVEQFVEVVGIAHCPVGEHCSVQPRVAQRIIDVEQHEFRTRNFDVAVRFEMVMKAGRARLHRSDDHEIGHPATKVRPNVTPSHRAPHFGVGGAGRFPGWTTTETERERPTARP